MNRYWKLLFVFVLSGCIVAYTNLFNRGFFLGYYCLNETSKTSPSAVAEESLEVCRGAAMKACVPPLMRYKQLYRTAKEKNLAACVIEKTFSTFLTAIMCFLHDSQSFRDSNRTLNSDIYSERLCKDKNEFTELKKIANWQKMTLFAVVRNPVERFVSGFTDKCLREKVWRKYPKRCAECKTNVTCFVEKMYERMRRFSQNPYKGIDFDDSHFFPQSWRCEFPTHLVKYRILQLDGAHFFDELLGMLAEQGVDEAGIKFINDSLHTRTPHSTLDSLEREGVDEVVRNTPSLLRKLIQMYYFDFLLFGYRLPDIPNVV